MPILFENKDWVVVDKPIGLSTHAAYPGDLGLCEWLSLYRNLDLHVCSRLDKDTSGAVLLARQKSAATRALEIHDNQLSLKTYLFLTDRRVKMTQWVSKQPIEGKTAETQFQVESSSSSHSLIRATLKTGRTHQIRRHAAESGCPILGDREYGGSAFPRLALHSSRLDWPDLPGPVTAPTPESFNRFDTSTRNIDLIVAQDIRGKLCSSTTQAWRLLQRREWPRHDVAVDWYSPAIVVWIFDPELSHEKLRESLAVLWEKLSPQAVVWRRLKRDPRHEGLMETIAIDGTSLAKPYIIQEAGLNFEVQLHENSHIGLFLDQRDRRQWVRKHSQGKRVLNLFSYSGSFSIAALSGGASEVVSVDISKKARTLFERNHTLNPQLNASKIRNLTEDVMDFLPRLSRRLKTGKELPFDIIICDPPTFSISGKSRFKLENSISDLISLCHSILSDTGALIFSTNSQSPQEFFKNHVQRYFKHVDQVRPPIDFPEILSCQGTTFFQARKFLTEHTRN